MAVGIMGPHVRQENQESDWDRVAKALSVAHSVMGIYDTAKQLPAREAQAESAKLDVDNKKLEQTALQRRAQGIYTQGDIPGLMDKFSIADAQSEGSTPIQYLADPNKPDSVIQKYISNRKDPTQAATIEKIKSETAKNNAEAEKARREKLLGSRELPATEAVNIGAADSAFKALDDVNLTYGANADMSGPLKGFKSSIEGKFESGDNGVRAKTFNAQLKANAQTIGRYLEGGKLAEGDIKRYEKMLPSLFDSPEAAQGKISVLQNLIAGKQQAELTALKGAGFNVSGLKANPMQQNPNIQKLPPQVRVVVPKELEGLDPQQQLQEVQKELIRRQGIAGNMPKKGNGI